MNHVLKQMVEPGNWPRRPGPVFHKPHPSSRLIHEVQDLCPAALVDVQLAHQLRTRRISPRQPLGNTALYSPADLRETTTSVIQPKKVSQRLTTHIRGEIPLYHRIPFIPQPCSPAQILAQRASLADASEKGGISCTFTPRSQIFWHAKSINDPPNPQNHPGDEWGNRNVELWPCGFYLGILTFCM